MQEHDGERSDAVSEQSCYAPHERALVQWGMHSAVDGHALGHLKPPSTRHQRCGLCDLDVVKLILALASDLEGIPKTLGGDEPGWRALALDHRIAEERGG